MEKDTDIVEKKGGGLVLLCTCKAEMYPSSAGYQDRVYGKGSRVHTRGGGTTVRFTCTVCGNTRSK